MKPLHESKHMGDRAGVRRDHSPIVNQMDELEGSVIGDCETCDARDVDVDRVIFLGLEFFICKRCQRDQ
jgi:hypothetical protein